MDNGSIAVIPNGGVPPYRYYWFDNLGNDSLINNLGIGEYTVEVNDKRFCEKEMTFEIKQATGIESIDEVGIQIFPSPATDFIQVSLPENADKNSIVEFYSIDQKKVGTFPVFPGLNSISISYLPKGIYTSIVLTNNSLYQSRFIKQ
ncbi:MAG: T9SS type A sorting domain-containing protein [Saprospiraceae bacterium]